MRSAGVVSLPSKRVYLPCLSVLSCLPLSQSVSLSVCLSVHDNSWRFCFASKKITNTIQTKIWTRTQDFFAKSRRSRIRNNRSLRHEEDTTTVEVVGVSTSWRRLMRNLSKTEGRRASSCANSRLSFCFVLLFFLPPPPPAPQVLYFDCFEGLQRGGTTGRWCKFDKIRSNLGLILQILGRLCLSLG